MANNFSKVYRGVRIQTFLHGCRIAGNKVCESLKPLKSHADKVNLGPKRNIPGFNDNGCSE